MGMAAGIGSLAGGLYGMFGGGGSNASNVQLPPQQWQSMQPGMAGAQGSIGSLGNYNFGAGFMPQAQGAVNNLVNNPYSGGYQGGANTFGGLGMGAALSSLGNAGAIGGTVNPQIGMAGAIANQAFDPQQALYNRTAQQVSDQSLAGLSNSGLATTPWGQGVYGNTMGNFNIDWQNQQLNRMTQGGQAAQGLYAGAGQAGQNALSLGQGATQFGAGSAGMPWNAYNQIGGAQLGAIGQGTQLGQQMAAIPQMQAGDWLSYMGDINQANSVANQQGQLALNQQNQGFNQNQAYGRGIGQGLSQLGGQGWNIFPKQGSGGFTGWMG